MQSGLLAPWYSVSWSSWLCECTTVILISWTLFGLPIEVLCQKLLPTSTCQRTSLLVWMWRPGMSSHYTQTIWNGKKVVKFNSLQAQASFGRLLVDLSVYYVPETWEPCVKMHRSWRHLPSTLPQWLGTSTMSSWTSAPKSSCWFSSTWLWLRSQSQTWVSWALC